MLMFFENVFMFFRNMFMFSQELAHLFSGASPGRCKGMEFFVWACENFFKNDTKRNIFATFEAMNIHPFLL